jgi:shikimate dehydrogenase
VINTHPNLVGLNVTMPFKQQVIDFLDGKDDVVEQAHACNCIKMSGNRLYGYNTDVFGFVHSFRKLLKPSHKKALVLGTGGASKAVCVGLRQLSIDYLLVSSSKTGAGILDYEKITPTIVNEYTIIINTTPIGSGNYRTVLPKIPYQYLTSKHYLFDVIYNPHRTAFLSAGVTFGATVQNGKEMLELQAEESWRIWNS